MATILVRYANGDEDDWELHEAVDLPGLVRKLSLTHQGGAMSFSVVPKSGRSYDFGYVGIRIDQVASWHIDGLVDPGQLFGAASPSGLRTDRGRAGACRCAAPPGGLGAARGSDRVEPLRHATCGTPLEARWYCPTCAEPVADETDADLRFV